MQLEAIAKKLQQTPYVPSTEIFRPKKSPARDEHPFHRILVCGGRDFTDRAALFAELDRLHHNHGPVTLLIHGNAIGADRLAGEWAATQRIQQRRFPADWKKDGSAAGPIRNKRILDEGKPDLVVAFSGDGTDDIVRQAREAGVEVLIIKAGASR